MNKLAVLGVLFGLCGSPAFAHPGTAQEHASLTALEHAAISALPVILVLVVIGLVAIAYFRKG